MLQGLRVTQFSFPTAVSFGAGEVSKFPKILASLGSKKPLVITDPGMVRTEAYVKVIAAIESGGLSHATYSEVHPNPLDDDVMQAVAMIKAEGCDAIIGLGGGSALDAMKVSQVIAAHGGSVTDYNAMEGGSVMIVKDLLPSIAVPTTAGTGSEVGRSAVITVPSLGKKIFVGHPKLMPSHVVMDPELTVSLPNHLTAATGMDAFVHCLESYTSSEFHPICDAVAIGGIEICLKYLERATNDGNDLEARGYMMIAAMMGGISFQKDLGAVHSLAHPLSTLCNVHHGLANAVCMAEVMDFNRKEAAEAYVKLAGMFGVNTFEISKEKAIDAAIKCVADLVERLGLPSRLRDCGVDDDQLEALADKAFEDPCHLTNARQCTRDDLFNLYKKVW